MAASVVYPTLDGIVRAATSASHAGLAQLATDVAPYQSRVDLDLAKK